MTAHDETKYPYPWYSRLWPVNRIFFKGFELGEDAGVRRGRFQMGDLQAFDRDDAAKGPTS